MAHQQITHLKMKEPRKLECKETLMSLQQWRTQFRQYVKQDDHYKGFLQSELEWNPLEVNYGFITETTGLKSSSRTTGASNCYEYR